MITKTFCEAIKCPYRLAYSPDEKLQHSRPQSWCKSQHLGEVIYQCAYIRENEKIRDEEERRELASYDARSEIQIMAALVKSKNEK